MKLAVISDIHVDEQEDEKVFLDLFSSIVNNEKPDILLIAGDISEYYLKTLAFIKELRKHVKAQVFFCAGNHDIWSKHETKISASEILDYMASDKGDENFLQNRAVKLSDKTVLIGSCGWYDYSFAYPGKFTQEELAEREYMGRWWRDSQYARHGRTDKEVDREWNQILDGLVREYKDYNVVFMTHMVNHRYFLVGDDHPLYNMFQYFNGFLGSEGLYKITKHPNVKYAISGHVHYRKNIVEDNTTYLCRCLGYPKEFPAFGGKQKLEKQIIDALDYIHIE